MHAQSCLQQPREMSAGPKSIASTDHPKVKISSLYTSSFYLELVTHAWGIRRIDSREGTYPPIDGQYRHEPRSSNTRAGRGNSHWSCSETPDRQRAASRSQFPTTDSRYTSEYFCVLIFFKFDIHCSLLLFQMSFSDTSRISYLLAVLVRLPAGWDG
jgi:hypothetical protein